MDYDRSNIHLARALKLENYRLKFEVKRLKIELSKLEDKLYLYGKTKCELTSCKEQLSQTRARERKTMTKMTAFVERESHYGNFYMKQSKRVFFKVIGVGEELKCSVIH